MKSIKIYDKTTVDSNTGEILTTTSVSVRNNIETFFMGRTTEGIDWILKFNNITEIQLFIIMLELENQKLRNLIPFTSFQVEGASKILNVSKVTIYNAIKNLIKNDFLFKLGRENYLANPKTFYKGASRKVINRHKFYEQVKREFIGRNKRQFKEKFIQFFNTQSVTENPQLN